MEEHIHWVWRSNFMLLGVPSKQKPLFSRDLRWPMKLANRFSQTEDVAHAGGMRLSKLRLSGKNLSNSVFCFGLLRGRFRDKI